MINWYSPEAREYYTYGSMYVSMANYGLTFSKGLTRFLINITSSDFIPFDYIKLGYDEDRKRIVSYSGLERVKPCKEIIITLVP